MKISILLIGLLFISSLRAQEGPTALLESLILESEQSLEDLRVEWETNQALFQYALASVQSQRDAQADECSTKDTNLLATNAELEANEHYIMWISDRIQENIRRVTELEENRCNSSLLYINGLKHNKIALKLLEFLRSAIQARESLSLVQRQQIYKRLGLFLQMYSDHRVKEMIQTFTVQYEVETDTSVQAREDVGTGQIDEGREQIAVESFSSSGGARTWPQFQSELNTLLDNLELTIRGQSENAQEDEMNAGIALADFKIQTEQENVQLDRHLYVEADNHGTLVARQTVQQNVLETCNSQLELANQQVATSEAQYQEEVDRFEARRVSLAEEISTFRFVYGMYTLHVAPTDDGASRQVDGFDFVSM